MMIPVSKPAMLWPTSRNAPPDGLQEYEYTVDCWPHMQPQTWLPAFSYPLSASLVQAMQVKKSGEEAQ
jgi:hypothetical protein